MDFRCGNVSAIEPHFPCFNAGVCQFDDNFGEQCICASGWAHDVIGWGHFRNCAIPESFLSIFFVSYSVFYALAWCKAMYELLTTTAKGKVLLLGQGCVVWSMASYANVVLVYTQGGYFEGAIITWGVYATIGFSLAAFTFSVLMTPVARRFGLRITVKGMSLLSSTFAGAEISIIWVISILAYQRCRDPNPAVYNSLAFGLLLQADIALLIGSLTIMFLATQLLKVLSKVTGTGTEQVMKQTKTMIIFQSMLISGALAIIIFAIIWGQFGSFPFMLIGWVLQHIIMLILLPLALLFFTKVSLSRRPSKQHQQLVSGSDDESIEKKVADPHHVVVQRQLPFSSKSKLLKSMPRTPRKVMTTISEKDEASRQFSAFSEQRLSSAGSKG